MGLLRRWWVELAWAVFAGANFFAMAQWPRAQTVPYHFVWISLAVVYGFRVWPVRQTVAVLAGVSASTAAMRWLDADDSVRLLSDLLTVPLLGAMFMAMVWHARRRVAALAVAERRAEAHQAMRERQERFVQDASHELRTPLTIARGHLELLDVAPAYADEHAIAVDELGRVDAIIDRLLTLAAADGPAFLRPVEIDVESYFEDVFMRWCELAPRAWLLGPLACGRLCADPERLRTALDALLENAVKYTAERAEIELRAVALGRGQLAIEVRDGGPGIPAEARARIFERFGRADAARTRSTGGVGLGLAIVDTIARSHGGGCSLHATESGSVFALRLPGFTAAPAVALGR